MSRPAFAIFAQNYLTALLDDFGEVYCNCPIPRNPKLRVYKIPSRSDWSTEILSAATAGNDRILISPEVIGEADLADVLFEPDPNRSRTALGLLGILLCFPSIVETLRWSPTSQDIRNCLSRCLKWQAEANGGIFSIDEISDFENKKSSNNTKEEIIDKRLLIIVPSIQTKLLLNCGMKLSDMNIPGVYELAPAFCTTVVATNKLPKNEYTLWLRILGRGPTQREAIQDLKQLKTDRVQQALVLRQLKQWYKLLEAGNMGKESRHLMQVLSGI